MGKGDMKTKRGKISRGTYGKRRRRKSLKTDPVPKANKKSKKASSK